MKRNRTLIALVVASVAATASTQLGTQQFGNAQRISWRPLVSGQFSNAREQRLVVLENENALRNFWSRTIGQPAAAIPKGVDWSREKVVAVTLGTRPTGGYRFSVQSVSPGNRGETVVKVMEGLPIPGTYVSQAQTNPWALIRVDVTASNFVMAVNKVQHRLPNGVIIGGGNGGNGGGHGNGNCNCNCGCPCCSGQ